MPLLADMSFGSNMLTGVASLLFHFVAPSSVVESGTMNERRPTTDPASPTLARAARAPDNRAPDGEETTAPAQTPGGASDRSTMETTDYSASASDVIASRSPTRRYTVLGRVAQGGMGVIFKVWDGSLHRPLAMKVIRGQDHVGAAGPAPVNRQALGRFLREAEVTGQLDHPGIVPVHEIGTDEHGRVYFTMRLVEGESLDSVLDKMSHGDATWTKTRVVDVLVKICDTLAFAHSRGVVHRDLKPANIMVGRFGETYVMDWGLAKVLPGRARPSPERPAHEEESLLPTIPEGEEYGLTPDDGAPADLTTAGTVLGTPAYMPPEQAEGRPDELDERSDVYSIGAMLYRILTGQVPYVEGTRARRSADVLAAVIAGPPTSVAQLAPRARGELVAICQKAMARAPGDRYADMQEMAADLRAYLENRVVKAYQHGALAELKKWVKRNPLLTGAAAALLLVTALGAAGIAIKYRDAEHQKDLAEDRRKDAEKNAVDARHNEEDAKRQLSNSTFLLAVAAYDDRNVPLARQRLARIEPGYRGWEWHYFRRQSSGGIYTLYGHTDGVQSVAFSPDGTRIVTGSADRTAKVWDVRTGTPLLELKGFKVVVLSVAFSPDGARIVTGTVNKTVKVWNARTGTPLLELRGHTSGVASVAFSPDGTRIVTAGWDKTAKVWDARTGTPLQELRGHTDSVSCVAFSPDGTRIITGSWDRTAKLWDARTGTLLWELKGHTAGVFSLAFSPDGTRIVTSSADQAQLWDARTGTPLLELKGHTGGVFSVAFSPDGTRIVTGSGDSLAKVWDARTGKPLLDLKGHTSGVASVAFSADGMSIVTGSSDHTAKLWDARTGTRQLELKEHTSAVTSVAFSPDGARLVTGSHDQTARVWNARTAVAQRELKGHSHFVVSVAFSPDGTRIVTGSDDKTARVWNAQTGKPLLELKGHTGGVESVAFSPDGTRILTGSEDKTAKLWDAQSGTPERELRGHKDMVRGVAFSRDGGRIVTGSYDKTAKVWDARTGAPLLDLGGHTEGVVSVAFSPDGTRLATGGVDNTAKVWDARTGTLLLDLKGHTNAVASVAFSPDGTRLVTGSSDNTVKVWDARTGAPLLELKGHTAGVRSVALSPDGTCLVSGSWDQTAKVWYARTGQESIALPPDAQELTCRRVRTRPNLGRYRESYEAARAAQDDFAARFYLNLLPPREQKMLTLEAAAEREIAAGRTQDALVHLVRLSTANPEDTLLSLKVAALQVWFGQDKEYAETCARALEYARGSSVPATAERMAKICCLRPSEDSSRRQSALALARQAVKLGKNDPFLPWFQITLGMAEYRSGNDAAADKALRAAAEAGKNNSYLADLAAFYRAMSLFRQGKTDEARKLARAAAANMKPLPKDDKNPLAGDAGHDDLILWLAYKEAKTLIQLDAAPAPSKAK
jgi:WD40 repeat protein/serine/threonine protein kinase